MENTARLHRALVDALQRSGLQPGTPVTVAEIYQDLVPYRTVRSTVGFALNADYEHALLELLAGEHDLARIEPAEAREALRLELHSPNPNLGMYRQFAACEVLVNANNTANDAAIAANKETSAANAARDAAKAPLEEPAQSALTSECWNCRTTLPGGRRARFCPHCGADQSIRLCRSCGEKVETGWKFCIDCGAPAS